jgi:hypothetical protein
VKADADRSRGPIVFTLYTLYSMSTKRDRTLWRRRRRSQSPRRRRRRWKSSTQAYVYSLRDLISTLERTRCAQHLHLVPSSLQASTPSTESPDSDAEDDELPDASPVALEFIKLRYLDFDGAFSFIQSNPSVMEESTTDGLLLEGFNAELKGQKDKAKRCVEKGLLVQYCRKLGKDGFRLFFQR